MTPVSGNQILVKIFHYTAATEHVALLTSCVHLLKLLIMIPGAGPRFVEISLVVSGPPHYHLLNVYSALAKVLALFPVSA